MKIIWLLFLIIVAFIIIVEIKYPEDIKIDHTSEHVIRKDR